MLHLGKKGFGLNDAAVASSRNWAKGRENLNGGNMLGLRLVVGNVILSLRSGGWQCSSIVAAWCW